MKENTNHEENFNSVEPIMDGDGLGCPEGYTMINGKCVADITPPPPGKDNEGVIPEG